MPLFIRTGSLFWSRRVSFMKLKYWNITRGLIVKINMENKNVGNIIRAQVTHTLRLLLGRKEGYKTAKRQDHQDCRSLSLWPSLHSTYRNSLHHHMNRRRHPSVPPQQNTLWGHAPLLCAHYEEQTEPVYKGQLKCGWWWKGVHHKRKQIRPMNNHRQTSSEEFWFESRAVVIRDVAIAYRPGAESTNTPELLTAPSFIFIAPGILLWGIENFKHHLMKKSGGFRHVFSPPLWPQHQRPELILCGPVPPPLGITCLVCRLWRRRTLNN